MSNISGMVIPNVRPQPSIDPWVFRELGKASFGDARLTARALRIASDCARNPDLSLASLYQGDWGSLKACYRFFDNTAATPAQILAPHQAATWARCAQEEWVRRLSIQRRIPLRGPSGCSPPNRPYTSRCIRLSMDSSCGGQRVCHCSNVPPSPSKRLRCLTHRLYSMGESPLLSLAM